MTFPLRNRVALGLGAGLIVSQLALYVRRLRTTAAADAGYLRRLHDTAELSQAAGAPDAVVDQVGRQLADTLALRGWRFEYGNLMGHPARLTQDGEVVVDRQPWDLERRGWPEGEIELRAAANGHYCGRFMILPAPGTVPSRQVRLVAVTLADHAGAALDTARPVADR
ncbi:hypothetical protein [Streptomyces sp. NPDC006638]|uniref:hypothetical protein n=1 Tax=Streptomyces sp. NPDC006638 TaxID=3157183 RepID=UPI0033ABBC4D